METETIRAVVYYEDYNFVIQCLEYDICTQGQTTKLAFNRLADLIDLELNEPNKPKPAPKRFFEMWDQSNPTESSFKISRKVKINFRVFEGVS